VAGAARNPERSLPVKNATARRSDSRRERLLVVGASRPGGFTEETVADLPRFLESGDLLVVNDAAALPASLPVRLPGTDRPGGGTSRVLELRLAGRAVREDEWWGVLFGEGSWRDATEHRPPPPVTAPGETLRVGEDLLARVVEVSPFSARLLRLRFDRSGDGLYRAFYRHGRPVQYSYLRGDLPLWDVQTAYGARPWAVEMPSAGRPLTWDLLLALRGKGVGIARLTHAAGLSSTGEPELDARLPLPEHYEIPPATVKAVAAARDAGRRVVAVGTTVVRALEGNATAHGGTLVAGRSTTDLVLGPGYRPRVVHGLLTGIHEPGTSHFALLRAFAPVDLLEDALRHADDRGFLQHEFGDSMLVLP
jgi:S-adenosylmethionine:tRNA ribosyltransferase-isomerase